MWNCSLEKAGKLEKDKKLVMGNNEENQRENHAFVSLKMFGVIYSLPFGSGQFLQVKILFGIKCQKILQQKHRAVRSHNQTVALFPSLPPCSVPSLPAPHSGAGDSGCPGRAGTIGPPWQGGCRGLSGC